ncbi:MAG TPA: amidohydrolase family protein [Coriobacteriia bacterium]|jgi:5-methylthioadenosine/S-adenosylhomocysteine deaminase
MLLVARYVLPVSAPHIEDGAVLVRGGRIAEVGPAAELKARHADEEVRDFGLAALLPGFVDTHTHLEYTAFRGLVDDLPYSQWKMQVMSKESALDAEDWEDSAALGAVEALGSGITTIADITASGASARAAARAGLRGIAYREVQTMEKARVPEVMREAAADVAKWRELSPGLLAAGIAPHAPYSCHPELFVRAAEFASAEGLPVAIHLAGSKDEYDFVKYGSSPLAVDFVDETGWSDVGWLPTGVSPVRYVLQWRLFDLPDVLAVHCVQVDDADIEVLADRGVAIAYCPRCNAKLGMGTAPLQKFLERGLRVGIGTDSPASNNTVDEFDEMRIGLLIQRGMTGEAAFFTAEMFVRLATLDAARALGMGAEIGSLEAGKQADIVAVDLSSSHQVPTQDPYGALVHSANQESVLMTMVGGAVRYDRGEFATMDVERAIQRVERMRAKLRG